MQPGQAARLDEWNTRIGPPSIPDLLITATAEKAGLNCPCGADLLQLTTDRKRADAARFYERLGFVVSHHGLKLALN